MCVNKIKNIKDTNEIFLFRNVKLRLCFSITNIIIINNNTVHTTVMLLKWYKKAILLDNVMNINGANNDEKNKI